MRCEYKEPLGRLIYEAAQDIKNFAEKILKPYGLTLEQFHLLKNMSRKVGMSQRELGDLVNKSPANITRILDRLEYKSLVKRLDNPEDRRTTVVLLTTQGQAQVQEVSGIFESFSSGLTCGITDSEQEMTKKVLGRLHSNLQSMSKK
jgi:DNA-binding MarR family transcriptional regulator